MWEALLARIREITGCEAAYDEETGYVEIVGEEASITVKPRCLAIVEETEQGS